LDVTLSSFIMNNWLNSETEFAYAGLFPSSRKLGSYASKESPPGLSLISRKLLTACLAHFISAGHQAPCDFLSVLCYRCNVLSSNCCPLGKANDRDRGYRCYIDVNAFRKETFSRPTRTISRPRAGLILIRAASSLRRICPALAWWF
jgi:hypothetical protein